MSTKNCRGSRLTPEQKEILLDFISKNPKLIDEKTSFGLQTYQKRLLWEEITVVLNSMGAEMGNEPKSAERWQKVWQDWRYNTRKKAKENFMSINSHKFSHAQRRLLEILKENGRLDDGLEHIDINNTAYSSMYLRETSNTTSEANETIKIEISDDDSLAGVEDNFNFSEVDNTESYRSLQIREIDDDELDESKTESTAPVPILPDKIEIYNTYTVLNRPDTEEETVKYNLVPKKRRKYRKYSRSECELKRMTKIVRQSMNAINLMCKTQAENTKRIVSAIEQSAVALQNLAECQIRQAEAMERQVSIDETRNSLLKLISTNIVQMKKT